MDYTVKVAKEGRICIPKGLRKKLNWDIGTKLKITETNGRVYLERADKLCKICGTTQNVIPNIQVCKYCVSVIQEIDLDNI